MRKIEYTFITIARQFLFISIFIYGLLFLGIITEIFTFKIDKYYEQFNFPLTYAVYLLLFIILVGLFFQHHFFKLEYNKETLTYKNSLLRKSKSVRFEDVGYITCDTRRAYFFSKTNVGRTPKDAIFTLPFFRGGRIDVVAFNKMLDYASSKEVQITKNYSIMPGYGKGAKILSFVYGFFAVCIIANCSSPLYTFIVLLSSH